MVLSINHFRVFASKTITLSCKLISIKIDYLSMNKQRHIPIGGKQHQHFEDSNPRRKEYQIGYHVR